jgi:hypothetical protein
VDPPKSKFLGAVACIKTEVTEFSHLLDQSSQAWCHLLLSPLIINEQRVQVSVHPLWGNVHIHQEPPSGGTPPIDFEGGIAVFLSMAVTQ